MLVSVHESTYLCGGVYAWMHSVLQKLLRKSGLIIPLCSGRTCQDTSPMLLKSLKITVFISAVFVLLLNCMDALNLE